MLFHLLCGSLLVFTCFMAAWEAWHHPAWHWLWRKIAALVLVGWGWLFLLIIYFETRLR
jgi:hypothetical protein